jgi:hypothetical protein
MMRLPGLAVRIRLLVISRFSTIEVTNGGKLARRIGDRNDLATAATG